MVEGTTLPIFILKTGFDTGWSSPTSSPPSNPPWICLALCTYIITNWKYFFFQETMITGTPWFLTVLQNTPMLEDVPFLSLSFSRTASGSVRSPRLTELSQLQQVSLFFVLSCPPASKLCQSHQLLGWGKTEADLSGSVPKAWGHWVPLHSFFPLEREVISRGDFPHMSCPGLREKLISIKKISAHYTSFNVTVRGKICAHFDYCNLLTGTWISPKVILVYLFP